MKSQQYANDSQLWLSSFAALLSLAILPETKCTWSNHTTYKANHKVLHVPKPHQITSYCNHIRITPYQYFLLHSDLGTNTAVLAIPISLRTDVNEHIYRWIIP